MCNNPVVCPSSLSFMLILWASLSLPLTSDNLSLVNLIFRTNEHKFIIINEILKLTTHRIQLALNLKARPCDECACTSQAHYGRVHADS